MFVIISKVTTGSPVCERDSLLEYNLLGVTYVAILVKCMAFKRLVRFRVIWLNLG